MLNKETATPYYQQINDYIKARIKSGEYAPGTLIPSEAQLCEQFGVSRITVRKAVQNLVDDGLVFRQHGKGSFVCENAKRNINEHFQGFTAICRESGITVYSHVLQLTQIPATPRLIHELKLDKGEPVVYLERVRFANYKPVIIERAYLPYSRYAFLLDEEFENQSLYKAIKKGTGIDPEEVCSNITLLDATSATEEEAKHLRIEPGTPLFVLKEKVLLPNGTPVHYTEQLMLTKTFQFMLSTPEARLTIKLDD